MSRWEWMLIAVALMLLLSVRRSYTPPKAAQKYMDFFRASEAYHQLPHNLLVRVADQESDFRPAVVSSEGAVGIMQIVPKWHPGVDPLNVPEAIAYAGKYLRTLHGKYGTWHHALAAYNWGQGNLDRYGLEDAPLETRNYVAEITRDLGLV